MICNKFRNIFLFWVICGNLSLFATNTNSNSNKFGLIGNEEVELSTIKKCDNVNNFSRNENNEKQAIEEELIMKDIDATEELMLLADIKEEFMELFGEGLLCNENSQKKAAQKFYDLLLKENYEKDVDFESLLRSDFCDSVVMKYRKLSERPVIIKVIIKKYKERVKQYLYRFYNLLVKVLVAI